MAKKSNLTQVVAIGASAGGLEPIQIFFDNIPSNTGLAFIVVQHLSPNFKSLMPEILAKYTSMQVTQVVKKTKIKPNNIYLITPRNNLKVNNEYIEIEHVRRQSDPNMPIDVLFESIAKIYTQDAVAIILSGTGSDGSKGVVKIAQNDGLVIAQDPREAEFDGMLLNAIATNSVQSVLNVSDIPKAILCYLDDKSLFKKIYKSNTSDAIRDSYEIIYKLLQDHSKIDFSNYKTSTISRRINRRIQILNIPTLAKYIELLQKNTKELRILEKDLLIGVTSFFRDEEAFDILEEQIIPVIVKSKEKTQEDIRIWIPACSTGEEAYSIAIMFLEYLRINNSSLKIKIFATDINQNFLDIANKGVYKAEKIKNLSIDIKKRYFSKLSSGSYQALNYLKDNIVFAQHNLITDPPFIRMDLVSCRNFLIYIKPQVQQKIMSSLGFAINMDGYLFLGCSETIGSLANEFMAIDSKWKIFKKTHPSPRVSFAQNKNTRDFNNQQQNHNDSLPDITNQNYDLLINQACKNAILVDRNFEVLHIFDGAKDYFEKDNNNRTKQILDLIQPALKAPLNTTLKQAKNSQIEVRYPHLDINDKKIDLVIKPLLENNVLSSYLIQFTQAISNTSIQNTIFDDEATTVKNLRSELSDAKRDLQVSNEEVDVTNEELQTSNEELVTSNEELLASNEELNSVNQELLTVNTDYQKKIRELKQANADIDNILNTSNIGTLVVDKNLNIRLFTSAINQVINIFSQDIGRNISYFTHHMKIPSLTNMLKQVINGDHEIDMEIEDTHNNWYILRVFRYLTKSNKTDGAVLTITNITPLKSANIRFDKAIASLNIGVLFINNKGIIEYTNAFLEELTGYNQKQLVGKNFDILIETQLRDKHQTLSMNYLKNPVAIDMARDVEINIKNKDDSLTPVKISLIPFDDSNKQKIIMCNILDITKVRKAEKVLTQNNQELEDEVSRRSELLVASEKKYSQLYHTAADMYASVDPKTGIIEQCNNTTVKVLGYSDENQIVGKSIFNLYHYNSLALAKEAFKKFQDTGNIKNTELSLKTKQGRPLPVILKINAIYDSNGNIVKIISSWRDISELKSLKEKQEQYQYSEQIFRENEELYNTVLGSVTDGWWDWQLDTDSIYMSPSFKKLFGYQDKELDNDLNTWKKLIFSQDYKKIDACIKKHIDSQGKKPFSIELRFKHKNGSTIWVLCRGVALKDDDGIYRRIVGTNMDITASKNLSLELGETKSFLELILDANNDFIFVKDQDFNIVQANKAFLSIYPLEMRDKVIGTTTVEKFDPIEAEEFLKNDRVAFEKGISDVYETVNMPSGKKLTLNTTKIRFYDKHKKPFILGICRDITEREKLYHEIEQTNSKLENINTSLTKLNKAHQNKIKQLTETNNDIRQLLDSAELAIIFLNKNLTIKRFSLKATSLFGLSPAAIGKSIFEFNENIDLNNYANSIKSTLAKEEATIQEINSKNSKNSKNYILKITPYTNTKSKIDGCILSFIDITDLRQSEQLVRENQDILQLAAKNAGIGIFNWRIKEDILEWNEGMFKLMPITRNMFKNKYDSFLECIIMDDRQAFNSAVNTAISTNSAFSSEIKVYASDKSLRYIKVIGEFYKKNKTSADRLTGICLDITPIKQAELELDKMARFDAVTGIANREFFLKELNNSVAKAKHNKKSVVLFFLDLDNFKIVNDTYGHVYGDMLLQEVVIRLREVLHDDDIIGRIGGDEFAISIEDPSSLEEIRSIASRCLETINQPFYIKDNEILQSLSLGISIYPSTATNVDDLLQYADTAMYRAKEKGKNNFVFFQDELDRKMQRNNKIEYALRRPVTENKFSVLYQPQYDSNKNITGIEALIRWQHPEIKNLTPDEFIPLAEKTRRIIDIGYWVLEKSIQDYLSLPTKVLDKVSLSINFSGIQLIDSDITTKTKAILDKYNIPPNKLIFEVTETHLMNQIDKATINMNKLSKLGIIFSLDDFGTGYSSLNYLAKLPINYLKIDKEFVAHINDSSNQTIIKTIISLGKSLDMDIVAEGVEQKDQFNYLKAIKCDKYQGFYLSKPITISKLKKLF